MEIRQVDVFDDTELHAYYEIVRAAELFERPEAPVWAEQEMMVNFRHEEEAEQQLAYGAFEGQVMVGAAWMSLPLVDNTTMTWNEVYVAPERRRQGIGGALVEHIVQKSQQRGRPVLLGEASYDFERRDDHPYRRFAEKHGFALASTEVWRRLDLPVREAQLQAWADEAAAHHADYAVETYAGPVPERLLASYCDVSNQLAVDAPSGDIDFEPEAMTPRLWREREAKLEEQGRTLVNTLALDKGGDVVGVTTLVVPEHDKPKVYQWTTQVLAGHRGHRLGLAIKAHNLLTLQRTYPDRTMILTCNEESNGPMVDINKRMGFRPVEILGEFQRKL